MTTQDEFPEADRMDQDRDIATHEEAEPEHFEVDPLAADQVDQVEQAQPVLEEDEEYDRP